MYFLFVCLFVCLFVFVAATKIKEITVHKDLGYNKKLNKINHVQVFDIFNSLYVISIYPGLLFCSTSCGQSQPILITALRSKLHLMTCFKLKDIIITVYVRMIMF